MQQHKIPIHFSTLSFRKRSTYPACLVLALLFCFCPGATSTLRAEQAGLWNPLIDRLVTDGLDRAWVQNLFQSQNLDFEPGIMARKLDSMIRKKFEPPKKPPTQLSLEQSNYRQFLKPWILSWAKEFLRQNAADLQKAESLYGVPKEVLVSILLVETKLGTYLGDQLAFEVLASMALCSNFSYVFPRLTTLKNSRDRLDFAEESCRDKSEWAYQELRALLAYASANQLDPLAIPGSIYGAIGICQFMPSNILKYGASANGKSKIDVFAPADALHCVASYLKGHGWVPNLDEDGQKNVVYQYNHSELYALAVITVADRLKQLKP